MELGEDVGALGPPAVGFGGEVALGEVGFHRGDQRGDAAKAAFAHDIGGEVGEEAFDEVEP